LRGPDPSTITEIVETASRAPSVHNSQPWLWEYDGVRLILRADWSRRLRHADAVGRDLLISCGAALHHAMVAAAALGWPTLVRRLPDSASADLVATLDFSRRPRGPVGTAVLEAIRQRVTDRRTPSAQQVPLESLAALVRVATTHGAIATLLPDSATEDLRDLMLLATVIQDSDVAYLEELDAWTRSSAEDGIPASSVVFLPHRRRVNGAGTRFQSGALLDHEPDGRPQQAWLLLSTSSDDPTSRVRAGEALSAILLFGTLQGLAIVPYTQPIEVDTARTGIEDSLLRGSANLQVILRIAVPPEGSPAVRRTRRRPVHDVLRISPVLRPVD